MGGCLPFLNAGDFSFKLIAGAEFQSRVFPGNFLAATMPRPGVKAGQDTRFSPFIRGTFS
jgi:hypothetical protein